ncbi:MAG TPA: hypothetical protein VK960_09110 [Acidimicrobiia bacterium]|nr:hypothetical protein [Acidimicrobiia bacterium]
MIEKDGRLAGLLEAGKILTAGALTWLPQSADAPVVDALTKLVTRSVGADAVSSMAQVMERCIGPSPNEGWMDVARQNVLVRAHGYWARARGIHRPGWSATLEVDGIEHLETAAAAGSGAILWRMNFCGSHVAKQALYERGYRLVHVTRPEHGMPGNDAVSRRVVAPLYTRAEVRNLGERVQIDPSGSLTYLRLLLDRLRANEVVSIMAEFPGRAAMSTKVFDREIEFATGAPSLARSSGAALLTMYARHLAYDHYQIVIEEPITIRGKTRDAQLADAVNAFGDRLERAVRAHPASWMGWGQLT